MTPYTVLMYCPHQDPPPPGPRHTQLCVAATDGLRATRLQGQLRTQGNVPSDGVSTYMRFPVPPLVKCRPPLTMHGVCDMASRP